MLYMTALVFFNSPTGKGRDSRRAERAPLRTCVTVSPGDYSFQCCDVILSAYILYRNPTTVQTSNDYTEIL